MIKKENKKKFNKKGFTLIELLAVIVILAIVMVLTIPSVIQSMNNARLTSFQNAANTVADWFQKQYDLAELGMADRVYNDWLSNNGCSKMASGTYEEGILYNNCIILTTDVVEAAGISDASDNLYLQGYYDAAPYPTHFSYVFYDSISKNICVSLLMKEGSSFATSSQYHSSFAKSSGCYISDENVSDDAINESRYDLYR